MSQVLTLDCCLYVKDIPVELWQIVHSYHFKALEISDISDAVEKWSSNREESELRYGNISQWYEKACFINEPLGSVERLQILRSLLDLDHLEAHCDAIRNSGLF
jgi:hypothetical protein